MFATIWNNLLFYPFLNLTVLSYHFLGNNLGLAVIFIAVITRLLLIPATKSQMQMTQKMSGLKPKLDVLQKKFANNQQKLAQEQMKLYKEVGYNPLGCLSSFLPQIVILYAIIQVINIVTTSDFIGLYEPVKEFVFGNAKEFSMNTQFLSVDLAKNYSAIAGKSGYFAMEGVVYFLLAAAVGIVQYFSTKFMQVMQGHSSVKKNSKKNDSPEDIQAQMLGSMNAVFPIMTFVITLSTPAVLGLYWLFQSIMFVVQYYFIDKEKFLTAFRKK